MNKRLKKKKGNCITEKAENKISNKYNRIPSTKKNHINSVNHQRRHHIKAKKISTIVQSNDIKTVIGDDKLQEKEKNLRTISNRQTIKGQVKETRDIVVSRQAIRNQVKTTKNIQRSITKINDKQPKMSGQIATKEATAEIVKVMQRTNLIKSRVQKKISSESGNNKIKASVKRDDLKIKVNDTKNIHPAGIKIQNKVREENENLKPKEIQNSEKNRKSGNRESKIYSQVKRKGIINNLTNVRKSINHAVGNVTDAALEEFKSDDNTENLGTNVMYYSSKEAEKDIKVISKGKETISNIIRHDKKSAIKSLRAMGKVPNRKVIEKFKDDDGTENLSINSIYYSSKAATSASKVIKGGIKTVKTGKKIYAKSISKIKTSRIKKTFKAGSIRHFRKNHKIVVERFKKEKIINNFKRLIENTVANKEKTALILITIVLIISLFMSFFSISSIINEGGLIIPNIEKPDEWKSQMQSIDQQTAKKIRAGNYFELKNADIDIDWRDVLAVTLAKYLNDPPTSFSNSNNNTQMNVTTVSGTPAEIIKMASEKYGVDVALIEAVIECESDFDPNCTSEVGAQGLMQIMPENFPECGINNGYDPYQNVMGGTMMISKLMAKYNNDITLVAAAYNAGEGNVAKYGGVPPFTETQNYVVKIQNAYNAYKGNKGVPTGSWSGTMTTGIDNFLSEIYYKFLEISTRDEKETYTVINYGIAKEKTIKDLINVVKGTTLRMGNTGSGVKLIQYLLTKAGIPVQEENFGNNTDTAVKKFQLLSGLKQDGIVGAATWNSLSVYLKAESTGSFAMGSTGEGVKILQWMLNIAGYSCDEENSFSQSTKNAVINYQKNKGIVEDDCTITRTKIVKVVTLTKHSMKDVMDELEFNKDQREIAEEMRKMDLFHEVIPNFDFKFNINIPSDAENGRVQTGQSNLNVNVGTITTNKTRQQLISTALSLVDRVSYFWGGKSSPGWNSLWGTPMQVTAEGSQSTGTIRPYGLDCSGFTAWVYDTSGVTSIFQQGGTNYQESCCNIIDQSQAEPGDLVFNSSCTHTGLFYKRENGLNYFIECGSHGVAISNNPSFTVFARPNIIWG